MARFCSLFSSSSGNATYIGSSKTGILIDAGVSAKRLREALLAREIDPASLSAIFVTHEHSDHIKGLAVFLSRYNIPLYASAPVLKYLAGCGAVPLGAVLNEIDEHGELIGGMERAITIAAARRWRR